MTHDGASFNGALRSAFAAQQPTKFRLPTDIVPTRYKLDLTLDPGKTEFSGKIAIDLDVRKATPVIAASGTLTRKTRGGRCRFA
jgi:hypothetical protein